VQLNGKAWLTLLTNKNPAPSKEWVETRIKTDSQSWRLKDHHVRFVYIPGKLVNVIAQPIVNLKTWAETTVSSMTNRELAALYKHVMRKGNS
jgi:hypothetical protein